MGKGWERLSTEVVQGFRIFELLHEQFRSPRTGKAHRAVVLDSPDWVNIVALTAANQVVLIEQFRFGTERMTLEIPGGLIDPGEDPLPCAKRELAEETGYSSERWTALGTIAPNPAFLRNHLHTFLAEDCVLSGEQDLDPMEDIKVELRDLAEMDALLANGRLDHALVAVAFQKLRLHREGLL